MKEELREIKKLYAVDRKTEVLDEIEDIKIDATKMLPKDDVVVAITKEGYVKRVSLRSYNKDEDTRYSRIGGELCGKSKISDADGADVLHFALSKRRMLWYGYSG